MGAPPPILVELKPVEARYASSCPLVAADVSVQVTGLVAEYVLKQRYLNLAEEPIEAVVRVPLPEGAVVRSLILRQAGRVIEAAVREKAQAQQIYAQARAAGQRAALAEEARDNLMLLHVNAITPNVPLDVEVSIAAHVPFEAGEANLAFPLTMTPRYIAPGATQDDAHRISPPFIKGERLYGVSFSLELNAGAPLLELESDSHLLGWQKLDSQRAVASLKEGEVAPDRDILLRWRVQSAIDQPQIESARVEETDTTVVMLSLPPPAEAKDEEILPRHVSFLLDRSGSMQGEPMNSAKRALQGFIRSLGGRDIFSVVAFDDKQQTFAPHHFSDASLQAADIFISGIDANGGTEILPALQVALAASVPAGYVRTVVLLTDGSVSNEDAVAAAVLQATRSKGLRAHGIGLGSGVNRSLVSKFARAGRGICEFVPNAADLAPMLARFQARSGAPLATDISIEFEGAPIIDMTPQIIGDLDLGQPLLLFARALEDGNTTVILRAKVSGSSIEKRYPFHIPNGAHGNPALVSLWAKSRIKDLLEEGAANRDEILRASLKHKILTSYTSLIAVDRQDAGTGETPKTVEIPAQMPAGNAMPAPSGPALMGIPALMLRSPAPMAPAPMPRTADTLTMGSPSLELDESEEYDGGGAALFGSDGSLGAVPGAASMPPASYQGPLNPKSMMHDEDIFSQSAASPKLAEAAPRMAPMADMRGRSTPEPEEKPGFFARLFGRGKKEEAQSPPRREAPAPTRPQAPPRPAPQAPPAVAAPSVSAPPSMPALSAPGPLRSGPPNRARVEAALRYLARQQSASGAFGDANLTKLIVEAFAAASETPKKGLYRRQLGRAETFLAANAASQASYPTPDVNQLIAAQKLSGDQEGAVVGAGETLLMTALLVKLLCEEGL